MIAAIHVGDLFLLAMAGCSFLGDRTQNKGSSPRAESVPRTGKAVKMQDFARSCVGMLLQ
jgi:hypothetical protein